MVHIVSDTSTLYSTAQAKEAGFTVAPLSVTIAGKSYREFDEISSEEFVEIIRQGHMPTSSQPAIGEVEDMYNQFPGEEIINVTKRGFKIPHPSFFFSHIPMMYANTLINIPKYNGIA